MLPTLEPTLALKDTQNRAREVHAQSMLEMTATQAQPRKHYHSIAFTKHVQLEIVAGPFCFSFRHACVYEALEDRQMQELKSPDFQHRNGSQLLKFSEFEI